MEKKPATTDIGGYLPNISLNLVLCGILGLRDVLHFLLAH